MYLSQIKLLSSLFIHVVFFDVSQGDVSILINTKGTHQCNSFFVIRMEFIHVL